VRSGPVCSATLCLNSAVATAVLATCLSSPVRLRALPHGDIGRTSFRPLRRNSRIDVRQRNVDAICLTPIMVRLEKRKPRDVRGASRTAAALVTYFQGGARATVRTLCQTSAAWILVRVKRDFLLAIRHVGNTAHIFSDKNLCVTANFSFARSCSREAIALPCPRSAAHPWAMSVRAPPAAGQLCFWRPQGRPCADCNGIPRRLQWLGEWPAGHAGVSLPTR